MSTVTLIFTTAKGFSLMSRLIRWWTRSEASHVAIGVEMFGVQLLLHATKGGVKFEPRAKYLRGNKVVREVRFRHPEALELDAAVRMLGTKYDYLSLLGYALLIPLWRHLKVWIKNPFASPSAVVCSEFVLALDPDLPEWKGLDPERTTAQDLLSRITSLSFEDV